MLREHGGLHGFMGWRRNLLTVPSLDRPVGRHVRPTANTCDPPNNPRDGAAVPQDSGGFQMVSLLKLANVTEVRPTRHDPPMRWLRWLIGGSRLVVPSRCRDICQEGVKFQSPHDGSELMLTPEKSIELQNDIGADIIMVRSAAGRAPCLVPPGTKRDQRTPRCPCPCSNWTTW